MSWTHLYICRGGMMPFTLLGDDLHADCRPVEASRSQHNQPQPSHGQRCHMCRIQTDTEEHQIETPYLIPYLQRTLCPLTLCPSSRMARVTMGPRNGLLLTAFSLDECPRVIHLVSNNHTCHTDMVIMYKHTTNLSPYAQGQT